MSTYLACFIVCDFQSLEPLKSDQGFLLTVYARRGQSENMKYAQFVGLKSINFYVNYFGIQYPLPKLGMFYFYELLILNFKKNILFRSHSNPRFCFWCYGALGPCHFS